MARVYQYLPLGLRVLNKIEDIIRDEMNAIGGQEILDALPASAPDLGKNRAVGQGRCALQIKRRPRRQEGEYDLALGPTHGETVTPLVSAFVQSYRDLPVPAYQIQTKFRNEARPKSGFCVVANFG